MTTISKFIFFTTLLVLGSMNVIAQCDGPANGGVAVFLTDTNPFNSAISTDDFTISFASSSSPGDIIINSASGLEFMINPMSPTEVLNVGSGVDISTGTFLSGPRIIYNNSLHTGPFGGGASGFIGVRKNGRFGWIEFGPCGSTTCDPSAFEFPILDRCLNGVVGGPVLAGNSGALSPLPSDPIPTLSEWGLILLGLFISIIGLVSIKSLEQQKIFS